MKKPIVIALSLCLLASGCPSTETPSNPPASPAANTTPAEAMDPLVKERAQGQFVACKSNMKNIGTALEMYSTDYAGHYPPAKPGLDLLAPNYLKYIPTCPSAGEITYAYAEGPEAELNGPGYGDFYEVRCVGGNHAEAGVEGDLPVYTGIVGLIDDPGALADHTAEMKAEKEKKKKENEN